MRPVACLLALFAVAFLAGAYLNQRASAVVPFVQADVLPDGVINSGDFLFLSYFWRDNDMRGDVNRDGAINSGDQLAIAQVYMQQMGYPTPTPRPAQLPGTRDVYEWPFSTNSIWNMPIGSAAQYVDAGLAATFIEVEDEILGLDPDAPAVQAYARGEWNAACDAGTDFGLFLVPAGLLTPLSAPQFFPNNAGVFLRSDKRTLQEGTWVARCEAAGPLYWGLPHGSHDIYGDGRSNVIGGHGGSGLSAAGGSLRKWEVMSDDPIRHVLKFTISAQFLNTCSSGHRWPAWSADTGYNEPGNFMEYKGTVCATRMGALLALLPAENCDALVSHAFVRRLCWTLQNYGAYVVDSGPAFWQPHVLNMEVGARGQMGQRYGGDIANGSFESQLLTLISKLKVVDNNGPSAVGGGGVPLQPLAPRFGP